MLAKHKDALLIGLVVVGVLTLFIAVGLLAALYVRQTQQLPSDHARGQGRTTLANINRTSWGSEVFERWGLELGSAHTEKQLSVKMRAEMLNQVLALPRRSTLGDHLPCVLRSVKWTPFPVGDDGRNIYNSSWDPVRERALARSDHVFELWGSPWSYKTARVRLDRASQMPVMDAAGWSDLEFDNVQLAPCRKDTTEQKLVLEDLRFAEGAPDLVTGVAVVHTDASTATAVLRTAPGGQRLRFLCLVPSPVGARVEKNWLFVARPDAPDVCDVLYSFDPLVAYTFNAQTLKLENGTGKRTVQTPPPKAWTLHDGYHSELTPFHMSSATIVAGGSELLLLLHRKDTKTLLYTFYCVYLDRRTLRPVAYLPFPVLTDVGVRILFPMSLVATERYYHVSCGVSDEIAGVLTYNRGAWEGERVAWPGTKC